MPVVFTPAVTLFGAVVAFSFLYTFDKTFRATLGPLLHKIGDTGFGGIYGHAAVHPLAFVGGWADDIERWTKSGLTSTQRAMSWSISALRSSIHELALTAQSMAHNYALAFDQVWHGIQHAVPHVVRQTIVRPVQKAATYSDAKLRARVGALAHAVGLLNAKVGHLTHATAGAIAAPFPRIGHLEREIANAVKGLKNVKWLWKYGTLAALGAAVLAKLGISYTRCARGKDFGKRLCKTNGSWLDDFFLATTVFLTATSVVEFIKAAQEGEELALESIQVLVTEFGELNLDRDAVKDLINPLSAIGQ